MGSQALKSFVDHNAPARNRGINAQADKAKESLGQDIAGDLQGFLDNARKTGLIAVLVDFKIFFRVKPMFKPFHGQIEILLIIARPIVASSANSRSPPIGNPLAIRVTFTPIGLSNLAK